MKRIFIKTFFTLSILLFCVSCQNINSQKVEEEKTVTVNGTINVGKDYLLNEADKNEPSVKQTRSAFPSSVPDGVSYTITPYNGSKKGKEVTVEAEGKSTAFSIPLTEGSWFLEVTGKNEAGKELVKGKSDTIVIDTEENTFRTDISIEVTPVNNNETEAKGYVDLPVLVEDSLLSNLQYVGLTYNGTTTIDERKIANSTGTAFEANAIVDEDKLNVNSKSYYKLHFYFQNCSTLSDSRPSKNPVDVGTYDVCFSLVTKNGSTTNYCDTINVFTDFTTDTWSISDKDNTDRQKYLQKITIDENECIYLIFDTTNVLHDPDTKVFYVDGTVTSEIQNQYGTEEQPYASLKQAAQKIKQINDGESEYTIILTGTITADSSYRNAYGDGSYLMQYKTENNLPVHIKVCSDSNGQKTVDGKENSIFYLDANNGNIYFTIENIEFTNASSSAGWKGSVLGMENCNKNSTKATVKINNCSIHDCKASGQAGTAVYNARNNILYINNTVFKENKTTNTKEDCGAAVIFYSEGEINNCTFDGNSSSGADYSNIKGGTITALYQSPDSPFTVKIKNSLFENTAMKNGYGSSYYAADENISTVIENSTFNNNKAYHGGTIFLQNTNITFVGKNSIQNNTGNLDNYNNVFLNGTAKITYSDSLTDSKIGVSVVTAYDGLEVITVPQNITADISKVFFCDNSSYIIDSDGKLKKKNSSIKLPDDKVITLKAFGDNEVLITDNVFHLTNEDMWLLIGIREKSIPLSNEYFGLPRNDYELSFTLTEIDGTRYKDAFLPFVTEDGNEYMYYLSFEKLFTEENSEYVRLPCLLNIVLTEKSTGIKYSTQIKITFGA